MTPNDNTQINPALLEDIEAQLLDMDDRRRAWATVERIAASMRNKTVVGIARAQISSIGLEMVATAENLVD